MGLSHSIGRGKKGKTSDFCTFYDPTHIQLTQSSYTPIVQKKYEYIKYPVIPNSLEVFQANHLNSQKKRQYFMAGRCRRGMTPLEHGMVNLQKIA